MAKSISQAQVQNARMASPLGCEWQVTHGAGGLPCRGVRAVEIRRIPLSLAPFSFAAFVQAPPIHSSPCHVHGSPLRSALNLEVGGALGLLNQLLSDKNPSPTARKSHHSFK